MATELQDMGGRSNSDRESYGSVNQTANNNNNTSRTPLLIREQDRFVYKNMEYHDKLFAILYIAFTLLIITLSSFFYHENYNEWTNKNTHKTSYISSEFWNILIYAIVIALVSAYSYLLIILRKYAYCLIWFTLSLSLLMCAVYSFVLIYCTKSYISGAIMLIIAFIQCIWMYNVRHRIEFTTALIILSMKALSKFKRAYLMSTVIGSILQISFILIWSIGFAYSIDGTSYTKSVIFLFVISFYWTMQLLSNIVSCTISGIIAVWYFLYPNYAPENVFYNSLRRSCTTSFGSLCYGSLVISIVQVLKLGLKCVSKIGIGCIECEWIEYVNSYAFVRCAMYGHSYRDGAKQTCLLFKSRGVHAVIKDDLTDSVCFVICLLNAMICGSSIALICKYSYLDISDSVTLLKWSFTAFFVAFAICKCVMICLKSAVHTIFVAFSEDPAALSFTKPKKYQFLTQSWNERYGSLPNKLTNPPRS